MTNTTQANTAETQMTDEQLQTLSEQAAQLLEAIHADRGLLAQLDEELRKRLLIAAGHVSRPDKPAKKRLDRAQRRAKKHSKRDNDQSLLAQTGIRHLRECTVFKTPRRTEQFAATNPARLDDGSVLTDDEQPRSQPIGRSDEERICYDCREPFHDVHFFYDQMCLRCGDFNFAKRTQTGDLNGRVALVTGARVKIGYQAAILLLRSGCRVICTTRFPRDAARRFAAEEDAATWQDRLQIYGLDMRHVPSVEALCATLNQHLERLDFIINNACQTVRRPAGFYDHMLDLELATDAAALTDQERALLAAPATASTADGHNALISPAASTPSALLSQVELLGEDSERGEHLFPDSQLDADLQQVDLRKVNSWRLKLAEVSTIELLEVHLVNAVAPFIINSRLKPLLLAVRSHDKHIVNVSAVEGQFYRSFKTDRHPHTNMAKASLNMMTRTSAIDYEADGIHMNSVDTGWVTDEDPIDHATIKRKEQHFHPPLDIVDGAARIVDPIFSGLASGEHIWGQFLKNYRITDW